MIAHEGLVTREQLIELRQSLWPHGVDHVVQALSAVEPELAVSVRNTMRNALKLLDPYAVPSNVTEPLFELIVATAVTASLAMHQSHRALWCDLAKSSALKDLDPDAR